MAAAGLAGAAVTQAQVRLAPATSASRAPSNAAAAIRHPKLPGAPPERISRRAFEALRKRTSGSRQDERARAAVNAGRAAIERMQGDMARRIGQAIGLAPPDTEALARTAARPRSSGFVPVLFISSSMPVATLRAYALQLERTGGVMALRGLPGGMTKVAPMAQFAAEILRREPACRGPDCVMRDVQLIVDPLLFRQHGVLSVPALAMIPGDPAQAYCEREADTLPSAHIIHGDAALSGLLAEYARLGGRKEVAHAQARLDAR